MFKFLLLLTILSTSIFASNDEEFPFLGLTISTNIMSFEEASREKEHTIGFRYGKQSLGWRTMFSYNDNGDLSNFELEIDNILDDTINGLDTLRVYIGGVAGVIDYNVVDKKQGYKRYFGGTVGFLFYLTDRIDLDISYHYNKVDNFEPLSRMKGASFSLHYFYQ